MLYYETDTTDMGPPVSYLFRSLGSVIGLSIGSALVQSSLRRTLFARLQGEDVEEVDERNAELRRESVDPLRVGLGVASGAGGGGGSYPGCSTPSSQMGSGHLSGVASLSSR